MPTTVLRGTRRWVPEAGWCQLYVVIANCRAEVRNVHTLMWRMTLTLWHLMIRQRLSIDLHLELLQRLAATGARHRQLVLGHRRAGARWRRKHFRLASGRRHKAVLGRRHHVHVHRRRRRRRRRHVVAADFRRKRKRARVGEDVVEVEHYRRPGQRLEQCRRRGNTLEGRLQVGSGVVATGYLLRQHGCVWPEARDRRRKRIGRKNVSSCLRMLRVPCAQVGRRGRERRLQHVNSIDVDVTRHERVNATLCTSVFCTTFTR